MSDTQTTVSCGQALVRQLESYGVDLVFGIPGVHTLEIYRGLAESRIQHVTPRHEQGAAFMADGYAHVSRRPGVCVLITGAGLTNAATGVASAYHDSHPLLVISSATDTRHLGKGRGALHDLRDQQGLMQAIAASSETVTVPAELPQALARAFAVLSGPRPRPAHVGIPIDVLSRPAAKPAADSEQELNPRVVGHMDPNALTSAAALLSRAARPMILLGGGAVDAGNDAIRVSDAVGAPIVTTLNGKGAIPDSHPAALGATVMIEPVFSALQDADVVLAVGTEFSEVDYEDLHDEIPRFSGSLIRIDSDSGQINTGREPAVALIGDAAGTLDRLATELQRSNEDRRADAAATAGELRARLEWWPGAEAFFPVLDAIAAALPEDVIIAADSTQLAYVGNCYLSVYRPRSYLAPLGYGTLGPALPLAIGAKLAAPDRAAACLIGDGGLLFTIAELSTAAELQLPIVVLVWHNDGYGDIRDAMDDAGLPQIGTGTKAPDYLKLAEGFGCRALRVQTLEAIQPAIASALTAKAPTVIQLDAQSLLRPLAERQ